MIKFTIGNGIYDLVNFHGAFVPKFIYTLSANVIEMFLLLCGLILYNVLLSNFPKNFFVLQTMARSSL